jgi:hypothetical protein
MQLEGDINRWLVSWGRPFLRGEVSELDLEERVATWGIGPCRFEHGAATWTRVSEWVAALARQGKEPWVAPGIVLGCRAAASIDVYASRVTVAPAACGADIRWQLVCVRGGRVELTAPEPTVPEAAHALAAALDAVLAAGPQHGLPGGTRVFAEARARLDRDPPKDWEGLPRTSPREARRLASAALRADVFGTSSSWSERPLEIPAGSALASALARSVENAIRASANAA